MNRFKVHALLWLMSFVLMTPAFAQDKPLQILFLGDNGHHQPALRFKQFAPVMRERGIELTYTDKLKDLNEKTLNQYAGLIIFANHDNIAPEQEKALLAYVESGHALIPLHCASYCFRNSDAFVKLVGGQFQRHGTGVFRTEITMPEHPIMKGFKGFESFDETYVHTKHNEKDRTVLEVRVDGEGREPYTWTRTQGKGRVFYTAWGHDERTWGNPGFENLVERGIRWSVGQDPSIVPSFVDKPEMTKIAADAPKFEYVEAEVPFYNPRGGRNDPIKKIQQPLSPEQSAKHISVPEGFSAKLFLSEPQLTGKPITMNWDEKGRLWVSETVDYPNELQREGEGRDRIRIYSDTDGDGVADKAVTFIEKLSIPTSLTFCRGGIIVHQAPHTLFLRDNDGDDVCDEKIVLFSGWGSGDTHAGPSNLHYGFDGWYYGIVGYSAFNGEVNGEQLRFSQGLYRFHVDVDKSNKPFVNKLEFLRSTSNNSWGVGFSEEGLLFGSTANGCPSVFCAIPNRYYERVRGWSAGVLPNITESNRFYPITENVRQVDWHGGFTAAAGHALYTARTYPPEYWNRTAFVTEPTGHLAATFVLSRKGADFQAKNSWNLVASDDEWVAPTMAEVGPDGNVWVIDWYNIIVQHNPTPVGYKTGKGNAYEIPLRDKTHGRIYRVVYEGGPDKAKNPARITKLDPKNTDQLIAALSSDNLFWRKHAQRLLTERGKADIVPQLVKLIGESKVDSIGLAPGALHAVALLGILPDANKSKEGLTAIESALKHKSPGVRRTAAFALPKTEQGAEILAKADLLKDRDAQVRLGALLAVADMPAAKTAAAEIVEALDDAEVVNDPILRDALTAAAGAHSSQFLAALGKRDKSAAWSPDQIEIVARVAEHIGRTGDVEQVSKLIASLKELSGDGAATIIGGLARGWPKDGKAALTPADEQALQDALKVLPAGARSQLISLGMRWGSKAIEQQAGEVVSALFAVINDASADTPKRLTAAKELVEFRFDDSEVIEKLLAMIGPQTEPEFATGLLAAISGSEASEGAKLLIAKLPSLTPTAKPAALRTLLSRANWTGEFVAAAARGEASLNDLSLDQKQSLANSRDRRLAETARRLLEKGGSLPNADRQKVIDELLPLTKMTGDPALGKQVFVKQCAKCHMHSGEGTKIGPDLTGMAVHPKHELLVHLIDPSRSVEGNFRVYTVALNDGRITTGLLASESKTTIEIVDSEAKRQVVQREDIEELTVSPKSLMPEGFEKQVMPADITNLLEFLTQRGQFLPIPLGKAATVVSTKGMFFDPEGLGERMVFSDWSAKTFEGVPFQLVDPQGDKVPNAILLFGPEGINAPKMPRRVTLPCNSSAKAIHFLSGVSGWGSPYGEKGSVSMIVRLKYEDGKTEDHELKNGEHFADYIRRVDVPNSKFAFNLNGRQLRYLAVFPQRPDVISEIELVKGSDRSAPIVMAVTVESAKKE
jgi:putative membrane-bound dehydrogenase-like protein